MHFFYEDYWLLLFVQVRPHPDLQSVIIQAERLKRRGKCSLGCLGPLRLPVARSQVRLRRFFNNALYLRFLFTFMNESPTTLFIISYRSSCVKLSLLLSLLLLFLLCALFTIIMIVAASAVLFIYLLKLLLTCP